MRADTLVTNIGMLVSPAGTGASRGNAMGLLDVTPDAAIAIADGMIVWAGPRSGWDGDREDEVDALGTAVIPALIDPHTHAIWGGDRLDDFEARASGVGYEEILKRGGGIRSTIEKTNATGDAALADATARRIATLQSSGAATIEVKSGYGFTVAEELRLLEIIATAAAGADATIAATLLIHVPPREERHRADYLRSVVDELIPATAARQLATAVDVFIERESFTVAEAELIFHAARTAGLGVKAHADQFHAIGGVQLAIAHGALSADHLEASGDAEIAALGASATVATILPGVTLHLGLPAAPARRLIEAGAAVAVGSDLNPGSSPLFSTQLAMALAVRLNGLTPAEALTAATANAAAALGRDDRGRLVAGQRGDLLILDSADWRDAVYTLGASPFRSIFIGGTEVG
ncbi:MAG TPA: imidazolonepropionase [Gemmatimonadales bacterium]|jgi:imidazolonepropionase